MTALSLDEVIEMRDLVQERFGVRVHMHDACGGQSFSVAPQDMTPELRSYLAGYFDACGLKVSIGDDGYFSVTA